MCPWTGLFLRLHFLFKQWQSHRYSAPSTSLPPLRVERDNARVNCCLGSFHSFIDKQFLHSVFKRAQTNQSMFL